MLLVWFAVLLAPASCEENSQWSPSPWYNISNGEVNVATPVFKIKQAGGSAESSTILFDVEGVAPRIDLKKPNQKGQVKVQGCMGEYSENDYCRTGKRHNF